MRVAATRARLDAELVRRKLARSRGQAAELIADGRVTVNGMPASKAATMVERDAPVVVRADDEPGWASRGAKKLLGALEAFADVAVAGTTLPGRGRVHRRVHRRAAAPRRGPGGRRRRRVRAARLAAAHRRPGRRPRPHERARARTGRDRRAGRPDRRGPVVHLAAHRAARRWPPAPHPAGRCCRWSSRSSRSAGRGSGPAVWCAIPGCGGRRSPTSPSRPRRSGWELAGAVASPLPGPSGNVEYFLRLRRDDGAATGTGPAARDRMLAAAVEDGPA